MNTLVNQPHSLLAFATNIILLHSLTHSEINYSIRTMTLGLTIVVKCRL